MTTTTITRATAAACTLLLLAACTDGDDREATGPAEKGVLDALWLEAGMSYAQYRQRADELRREELVAECMQREGFEYTPVDYTPLLDQMGDALVVDEADPAFVAEYGYGIARNPWSEVDMTQWVDPNAQRFAQMSPDELEQYNRALLGEAADPTADYASLTWEQLGCKGWAEHEVGSGVADVWTELEEELAAMQEAVDNDPDVLAALEEWSGCMADAGYTGLATFDDARALIESQVAGMSSQDFLEGAGTEADYQAAVEAMDERLAEISQEEVELATTDVRCRDESGYSAAYGRISTRLQQEIYDAHRAELDAWLEAMTSEG